MSKKKNENCSMGGFESWFKNKRKKKKKQQRKNIHKNTEKYKVARGRGNSSKKYKKQIINLTYEKAKKTRKFKGYVFFIIKSENQYNFTKFKCKIITQKNGAQEYSCMMSKKF